MNLQIGDHLPAPNGAGSCGVKELSSINMAAEVEGRRGALAPPRFCLGSARFCLGWACFGMAVYGSNTAVQLHLTHDILSRDDQRRD